MERLAARLIDLAVWLAVGFAWSVAGFYFDAWFLEDPYEYVTTPVGELRLDRVERIDPVVAWTTSVGALVSVFLVEVIPTVRGGQSLGKRRLGLRVVGANGGPPSRMAAALRSFAWMAPGAATMAFWGATFGEPVGIFAVLFLAAVLAIPGAMFRTESHRGLHDFLAGTRVLSDR
jgi:uncharacterized RDD family membrane protein YckC